MLRKNESVLLFIAMLLAVGGFLLAMQDPRTLGFFSIFLAGDSVSRSFSNSNPAAGSTLTIYLNVDVGTAGYYALEDHLPSGWTVVPGSTGMYTDQAGVVKWLVYTDPVDTTLSYQTVVPAGSSGSYTFTGTYIFEGGSTTNIGGASAINVGGTDSSPPVISGVSATVSDAGTGATVSWSTSEDSNAKVEYGLSIAYGQQVSSSAIGSSPHTLSLGSSLQLGKTYYYKVTSADSSGNSATSSGYTFTTPSQCPEGGISGTACVCGSTTKSTGSCCSDSWESETSCGSGSSTDDGSGSGTGSNAGSSAGGAGGSLTCYGSDRDGDGVCDCPGSIDKNESEKATITVLQEVSESSRLKKNLPYYRYLIHGTTGTTTVYYTPGICDCNPSLRFVGKCRSGMVCRGGSCVVEGAGSPGGDLITGLGGDAGAVKSSIFSKSFETAATPEGIRVLLAEAGYGEAEIRYAGAVAGRLKFLRKIEVFKIIDLNGTESYSSLVTISGKNVGGTNLTGIVVLEKVSKSIAQNISEIYSDFTFNTYVNDPIIEFPLGDMNAGGESSVSYSVRRDITKTYPDFIAPVALSLVETVSPVCKCGDNNPCTADGCNPDGSCTHRDMQDGTKCGESGSCARGACAENAAGFGSAGLFAIGLAILMLVLLVIGIVVRHGKRDVEEDVPNEGAVAQQARGRDSGKQRAAGSGTAAEETPEDGEEGEGAQAKSAAKKPATKAAWQTKGKSGGAEIIEEDA